MMDASAIIFRAAAARRKTLLQRATCEQFDSSEDLADDDDVWTSLEGIEFTHLGITVAYQLLVLVAVTHLWLNRKWPPYCPRQISLVCLTGLAGVVSYVGTLIASGAVDRHDGNIIANCGLVSLLDYTGWGVWISVALVRVYRSWNILVRHSVDMWPAWAQVALLAFPWCIPTIVYWINGSLSCFNERKNWCSVYEPVAGALYIYGCVPIIASFFLVYQMRRVRRQMNEYRLQVFQLVFLLLTRTVVVPLQATWLDTNHEFRRVWAMYFNVIVSLVIFLPPVAEPMYRFAIADGEYLYSYTKGFSTLPTPAQMKSSLRQQLSSDQLREEFEKFAESKVARELPDFYKACLDRDEMDDFFARQAATTAIIDRFIRTGSEQEVNVGGRIREKIISTEITSYNIFNEAMSAVVLMMETNFSVAFRLSDAYKRLEESVKNEAEELERLKKMKQLPAKDHIRHEPGRLGKIMRKMLLLPPASTPDNNPEDSASGATGATITTNSNTNNNNNNNHNSNTNNNTNNNMTNDDAPPLRHTSLNRSKGSEAPFCNRESRMVSTSVVFDDDEQQDNLMAMLDDIEEGGNDPSSTPDETEEGLDDTPPPSQP